MGKTVVFSPAQGFGDPPSGLFFKIVGISGPTVSLALCNNWVGAFSTAPETINFTVVPQ
jgi:hypothetical protein